MDSVGNLAGKLVLVADSGCSENDITGVIEPTFSTEDESFGEVQTIDLKPNGRNIEVTNDNKKEYIEYESLLILETYIDP